MEAGLAIAGIFICLWAPVVVLSGHVGLLVDRVETRGLLVGVSAAQACVALALAFVGSLWAPARAGGGPRLRESRSLRPPSSPSCPYVGGRRTLQAANGMVETARARSASRSGRSAGASLVATGGTAAAMSVDAVSFVVVGAAGLSLAVRRRPEGARTVNGGAPGRISFLFEDRIVGLMVVVVFVSLLFMSRLDPRRPRLRPGRPRREGHRHRGRPQRLDGRHARRFEPRRPPRVARGARDRRAGRRRRPGAREVPRAVLARVRLHARDVRGRRARATG